MNHVKSLTLVSVAFLALAGCKPPPAATSDTPAATTMPTPEVGPQVSNAIDTQIAPATTAPAATGNTMSAQPGVNGVAAASDEPRAGPDRRIAPPVEGDVKAK